MSVAKSHIKQLLYGQQLSPSRKIENLVYYCQRASLQELQYIVRELSYILYQKDHSCSTKLIILEFFKSLLLTGSFPAYILFNIYISPWLLSINNLYRDRPLTKRCQLLYRDAVSDKKQIDKDELETYKELLKFSQEFIVFFGQNLKYHPFSKYKIKNKMHRKVKEYSYCHSLNYFDDEDKFRLQKYLKQYSPIFREHLKVLTQFISNKVEQCLTQSTTYQETTFLLAGMVELAQSYCITTILYRTCNYIVPQFFITTCQFLHSIYSLGQIEAIQIANSKCLPLLLQYLLPVDFKNNKILPNVKHSISNDALNKLADYYHMWHDMTRLVGLSTSIYDYSCEMVSWLKKPAKLTYQHQIQQFSNRINMMKNSNDMKRSFVIDQNLELENYIVNILKDSEFCLRSQHKQKAAYENILDELTITQSEQEKMSEFSRSMLKSTHGQFISDKKHEKGFQGAFGLLKNKFTQIQSSISNISRQNNFAKFSDINLSRKNDEFNQNIYYSQQQQNNTTFFRKSNNFTSDHKFKRCKDSVQKVEHSQKYVHQLSARTVNAHNSNTPQKTPVSSSQQSFLNSSQFSYKQNRKKQKIESIYLSRDISNEDSGSFVNFDPHSITKSEKQHQAIPTFPQFQNQQSQIYFQDSVHIKKSDNELIQYGMDKEAKIPKSLTKPKFAFSCDTNDSSIILKDLNRSLQKSFKNEQMAYIQRNVQFSPISKYAPISVNSNQIDKRTDNTKAPIRSQSNKSISSRPEEIIMFKKKSEGQNTFEIKNIYLNKEVVSDGSQINDGSVQPCEQSQYENSKDSVPSNFSAIFKRKNKRQKSSSLSASIRSLPKIKLRNKPIQMPNLQKMHQLQRQLGQLKQETQDYQKIIQQRQKEKKFLQIKTEELIQQHPYFLKKQNQIIKQMIKQNKNRNQFLHSSHSSRSLGKQLRQSSIRCSMSLKNYNPQVIKLRLNNIAGYSKSLKKNIISNRCFLINNDLLQIGYSFKHKIVTLYFTLKHHCDSLQINLDEHSILYSESIQRQFDKIMVDKQLKFKTEVKGTKNSDVFLPSILHIRISYKQKQEIKIEQFMLELPLTPYNIATPSKCSSSETNTNYFYKDIGTHYVTPLYNSCEDLIRKGSKYLQYIFPYGFFDEDTNTFVISYIWKESIEKIKIKLKQRAFRVEGVGKPTESGRQLIQTVINLLSESSA